MSETTAEDRERWIIRGDDAGRAIRDLNRALAELAEARDLARLALAQVKETTAVLDLVSLERNELRAEVERLKAER